MQCTRSPIRIHTPHPHPPCGHCCPAGFLPLYRTEYLDLSISQAASDNTDAQNMALSGSQLHSDKAHRHPHISTSISWRLQAPVQSLPSESMIYRERSLNKRTLGPPGTQLHPAVLETMLSLLSSRRHSVPPLGQSCSQSSPGTPGATTTWKLVNNPAS